MNLSEKIQLCRKRAGLSQEALAERLGVSRQAVSKWETGAAEPDLSKLRQLAAAFDVTADWLLSNDDVHPNAGTASAGRFTPGDASSAATGRFTPDDASSSISAGRFTPGSASSSAAGRSTPSDTPSSSAGRFTPGDASSSATGRSTPGGTASSSAADQTSANGSTGGTNPASDGPGAASSSDSPSGGNSASSADSFASGGSPSSTAEDSSRDSASPNWVESVPGVLGRLLRQYGWLVGLRMAVSGALMTFIGVLGRLAVRSMNQSFSIDASDLWIPSETAWYDEAGNLITSAGLTTRQPSDPVTLLCTGMTVLGVILIVAGTCIAVSLKLRDK